jgi:hypothetical protein
MMTDRDSFVEAWLAFQRNWWAFQALKDQIGEAPSEAWQSILALLAGTNEAEMIRDIGCGPLEDFVCKHGDAFINEVEVEARTNDRLRTALAFVWIRPAENGVVPRLEGLGCQLVKVRKDGAEV